VSQAQIAVLTQSGLTLSELEQNVTRADEKYLLDVFRPALLVGSISPEAVGRFIVAMKKVPSRPNYEDSHNIVVYTTSMIAYLVDRQISIY
jgi:hypothetical protein